MTPITTYEKNNKLIRAEGCIYGLCYWPPTLFRESYFLIYFHLNIIIYEGFVIFILSRWGSRRDSNSLWGVPFSSWGIKDHQCASRLMWSEEEEKQELQIWHGCTFEVLILSLRADGKQSTTVWSSPALTTHRASKFICFAVGSHFLSFFSSDFPHFLAFWQAGVLPCHSWHIWSEVWH